MSSGRHVSLALAAAFSCSLIASAAAAQTPATPATQRSGYSLPWGLRPAIAADLARLDTTVAVHAQGVGAAFVLTAGGRPFASLPDVGFYGRIALAHNAPDGSASGTALGNPMALALWTPRVAEVFRLSFCAGVSIPVGMGGGSAPDPAVRAAALSGVWTRSSIDSDLFASNYLAAMAGVGFAYVAHGLTVQAEVTLLELARTRVDADESRLNFTSGLHVGYRVIPQLTVSAEMRYQRWISTPRAVESNAAAREQLTAGLGVRGNFPLSDTALMRPGVAYFHPVGGVMDQRDFRVLVFDVAFVL